MDIVGPLAQFQATRANKDDTKRLVQTINQALGDEALQEAVLDRTFEVWWPELEGQLGGISLGGEEDEPRRSERQILEELLELTRAIQRKVAPLTPESVIAQLVGELETVEDFQAMLRFFGQRPVNIRFERETNNRTSEM